MGSVQLLVGTRKGAFRLESDDRREWRVHDPTLKGWDVANVALDPRVEDRLLAAVGHFVYGPTVHRSDDMGRTWEQVERSPSFGPADERDLNQVWTVVPGPAADPDVLYAGTDDVGLFRSTDGGATWTELDGLVRHETRDAWHPGKGGLCLHSICPHPTDPATLWVGISAVGVFQTTDGGDSWALRNEGLPLVGEVADDTGVGSCVHRLVADPTDPGRLFQQNHMGTFRTQDGGRQWERVDDGLPSTFGFPLVGHPRDPDTLYTVPLESDEHRMVPDGEPAVYRTTDAGDAWERCADGLPTDSWVTVLRHAMVTDGGDPAGVYAGTTGGDIYCSRDGGDTWTEIDCALPRINSLTAVSVE